MKLQLDTTNKTVKIENDIKVSQLIKTLKSMLPNDWKDFTLQTNVTINNWTNPIVWPIVQPTIQPYYQPWYFGYQSNSGSYKSYVNTGSNLTNSLNSVSGSSLKAGIYNVEVK
jgi:hypothetical protein